jgi:hypothetical protein
MCRGSIRSSTASRARVHVQISAASLHSVNRCWSVSKLSQWQQRFVSVIRIAARRSFVGMMSCNTVNQVDFICSVIHAVCKLCHSRVQLVVGRICMTLISLAPFSATAIVCSVQYSRLFLEVLNRPCRSHDVACMRACLVSSWHVAGSPAVRSSSTLGARMLWLSPLLWFAATCGWVGELYTLPRCLLDPILLAFSVSGA